jgi:hypothetical protein
MLNKHFSKVKYILILACLIVFPIKADAGTLGPSFPNPDTDDASFQLFFYWDLRDRESLFQVFNKSNLPITVHIELFNAADEECPKIEFYDAFTPFDTNIYDVSELEDEGFGFAVATVVSEEGGPSIDNPVLIGNFRVMDDAGYEYRSNPAGFPPAIGFTTSAFAFNFNDVDGTAFSDVVGIAVTDAGAGFDAVNASPAIVAVFDTVDLFDDIENPFSCFPVAFVCGTASLEETTVGFNLGINDAIVNSKGGDIICPLIDDERGFVRLEATSNSPPEGFELADFFVGFIGLSNGDDTGSMDVFTVSP